MTRVKSKSKVEIDLDLAVSIVMGLNLTLDGRLEKAHMFYEFMNINGFLEASTLVDAKNYYSHIILKQYPALAQLKEMANESKSRILITAYQLVGNREILTVTV